MSRAASLATVEMSGGLLWTPKRAIGAVRFQSVTSETSAVTATGFNCQTSSGTVAIQKRASSPPSRLLARNNFLLLVIRPKPRALTFFIAFFCR